MRQSVLLRVVGGLLGMLGLLSAAAQTTPPAARELSAKNLRQVVATLADDKLRGRALNTGAEAAAHYLAAEFKRAGLQPLPGQVDFEQKFPLYQSRSRQLTAELNGAVLPPAQAVLLPGAPEFSWSSTAAQRPHVLRIGPDATLRAYTDSVFKAKTDVLVLVHPKHAKWFNSLAAHYAHNYQYGLAPPAPVAVVLLLSADLTPTSYRASGRTEVTTLTARNVVGVLPGHDPARAAEQIVFSSHYDHIGILKAVAGDSIANGADDDASGTAAVVALANYYHKRHDNARPLVFAAFTAEEVGGFGSQYFARQLDAKQVTAMFNLEMLGTAAKFGPGTSFITGFDKSDFGPILQRNLQGSPYRVEPDPYPEQNLFYRSDNATLARLGVPAHTISTAQIPTDKFYHSVDDEVESLDFNNLSAVVNAVALGARSIVAGQDTPTRIAPEK